MTLLSSRVVILSFMSSVVSAYGIGERLPTKTTGYGEPHLAVATEAPSWGKFLELIKLKRQEATNICTEWTLLGGEGRQPACTGRSTCVFNTISGYGYEACALPSSSYYQITDCYDWPTSYAISTAGELYCDVEAPYCGTFEFVFDNGNTYSNFGCSDAPYYSTAVLIPGALSSFTTNNSAEIITTTSKATSTEPPLIIITNTTPTSQPSDPAKGNSSQSTKHKKSMLGAIIGAVVGGVVLIVIIVALIGCCLYKKYQAGRQEQKQANASSQPAYHATQTQNALGIGMGKQDAQNSSVIYNASQKPMVAAHTQEMNYNPTPHSPPPPTYNQPSPSLARYTELSDEARMDAASPASAMYPPSPAGGLSPRPQSVVPDVGATSQPHVNHVAELPAHTQHSDVNGPPMSENYPELR